ncbi:MAG: ABC transporter permease [Balneolaceae bacterium]|nr:ABC transporter permease [Balneolaceae bacterium]
MLVNYIKIAVRNFTRQKGYALINVLGLAIGIGIFLFLVLLDQYALTFDTQHENSERIYRLADKVKTSSGSVVDAAITPAPWGKAIAEQYPEVEESVRFLGRSRVVARGEKIFPYSVTYVDASAFRVFTYPFKLGNPDHAFDRPHSVVLTETAAETYFGNENPLGETLTIDDLPHEVTGVLEKLPDRYSFKFNMLLPFSSLTEASYSGLNDWKSHNLHTYLLLSEGADAARLEKGLQEFIVRRFGEEGAERYQPHLQPLESIYLGSDLFAEHGETLDIAYIYIFSSVAFLILLIACINFVNMATARGMERSREVGMRKVLGAGRIQLIFQFLSEALILATLAALLAMQLVELALPWFNDLAEWNVQIRYTENLFYLGSIAGVILLVGLLAGGYPAFYLSSFRPAPVLKGDKTAGKGGSLLRTSLVVFQFTVGIFLIISSAAVEGQLQYLKNKDLGFETGNILVTSVPKEGDLETIRQELTRKSAVASVTYSSNTPGHGGGSMRKFRPEGRYAEDGLLLKYYSIDERYLEFYDIKLLRGRNFNSEIASDTAAVIINRAAAQKFGWSDPIGKRVYTGDEENERAAKVVGVVENFHHEPLHNAIQPLILNFNRSRMNRLSAKLNSPDLSGTAEEVSAFLRKFNNGLPMGHSFLEEDISRIYTTEEVIGEMLRYFTYLTIFIACLGLLGLASYTIIQRQKEIGIRKVLGATASEIMGRLSVDFLKLIGISFLIAAPLAYLLLDQWLNSFAYSADLSPMLFAVSGLLAVGIAAATVGYHTLKAARINPVESLRRE